jgi:hypothetical protein
LAQAQYSFAERCGLWGLAVVGLLVVNGAFFYGVFHPEILRSALENPIALAFIIEALLLVVALAYLLTKWGVISLGWSWFVLLSLLGSLAFALPVAVLHGAERPS